MYIPPNRHDCRAYPFANDKWQPDTVIDLYQRLRQQNAENRAALVIGSGGMPYLLGAIAAPKVQCRKTCIRAFWSSLEGV